MKNKIKKILIPFILLMIFNLGFSNIQTLGEFGIFSPHVGVIFISGLLFGPYGALGATIANFICDLITGFTIEVSLPSEIFTFGVSLLAYKLWYSNLIDGNEITPPSLNNYSQLALFLLDLIICATLYSVTHGNLIGILLPPLNIEYFIAAQYFMNFINISFVLGIISIWISKKIDFVHTPKTTTKTVNKKAYKAIFYLIIILVAVNGILLFIPVNNGILIVNLCVLAILLYAYLTKPFEHEVKKIKENTISQKVMRIFLITTLIMVILAIVITFMLDSGHFINANGLDKIFPTSPLLMLVNIISILFFIPTYLILRYIEKNMIQPISSFSEVEEFIHENQKIESEGLLEIYSKYLDEKNEIGTLARSYTDLINNNNHYIENIHKIESEKERINAELDIARRIQQSNLPTESIETDEYIIDGYSQPAKEVGGDFFDYYDIDGENLVIVIGDASGKGVPAAILATITQKLIKHLLKSEKDPSQILFLLNNELCENNAETMFITLWIGIYNKTTKMITFSNAGHNPPLVCEDGEFKYLNIDTGLVLGVMEDFEFKKEEIKLSKEIILFTDGITDANNDEDKMYGSERLLNFFNKFESDEDPIKPLFNDITNFTRDIEQFDDMTILYLKDKHD